jgi:molecular chaperone GrpE (heat shock protein)
LRIHLFNPQMSSSASFPPQGRSRPAPSEDVTARTLQQRNSKKAEPPNDGASDGADENNVSLQLEHIAKSISQLSEFMTDVHEKEAKAFDALYDELSDYKNDFFAERLKPFAKSLLFLLDSIREYDAEVEAMAKAQQPLDHESVRLHVAHFADQLDDALRMVDLEPVELEGERFNPKTQRAIQVVPVEKARDGHVVRVVRPGWTLGGKALRPADVIVGKS